MTALNSEGLEKAVAQAIFDPGATEGYKGDRTLTEWQVQAVMRAITSHTPALPPVDGLEVVAWDVAPKGLPAEPTKSHSFVAEIERQGGSITPLIALSQASSVIEGLKEANEALMRERTSLIETKREQIERLTKERDEAVDNGHDWFNVSQDRMERISSLEEENKRLREALKPIAEEADHAELNAGHDGPLGQYVAYDVLCAARQALGDHNG